MPMQRKQIKHFAAFGEARALTFSCYRRIPVFAVDKHCEILTNTIEATLANLPYHLLAFVYMPEHVHLLVMPREDGSDIAKFLWQVKRNSAREIHAVLRHASDTRTINRLTYGALDGSTSFRLWQAGPGYDRNVRDRATLANMLDYIHNNPVRRGLCAYADEYRWSSWQQLHGGENSDAHVPKVNWPEGLTI